MCILADFKALKLCNNHRQILFQELETWHQVYLPTNIEKGLILDLGAGCGETTQFYLNHGAVEVVAIEQDPNCFANLTENFQKEPRVRPLLGNISHIKSDIEGGEFGAIFEIHRPFHLRRVHKTAMRNVGIYRLDEDWGNPIKRLARKYAEH